MAETEYALRIHPFVRHDPKQRRPNIALAQKELGWQPKTALRDGLKPTVKYFRELLKSMDEMEKAGVRSA